MNTQDHAHDLLGAYMVDAVSPSEAALVEDHLRACATCRELARELRDVVDRLPALSSEVTPPAGLRSRIMTVVAEEAQEVPASAPRHAMAGQPSHPAVIVPRPSQAAWSQGDGQRPRGLRWPSTPLLAVAALLAVLLVGVTCWKIYSSSSERPLTVYALAGAVAQPAVGGSLSYYGPNAHLQLHVHGLRLLPSQQVYEVWLIRGHYRLVQPFGTFRPAANGQASVALQPADVHGYTMVCLTVERSPGTQRPTLPLVAAALINR